MPRLRPVAALAFILTAFACSESSPTDPPDNGGDDDDDVTWQDIPFEPDPLDVSVALAAEHSATGTITQAAGGTIEAIGADGTTYSLVVPPNAVVVDTDVTLTPVSSISGYPFEAGMQAGVQFAPDGLQLLEAGMLHITPASPTTSGDLTAFAYNGNGADFHLVPATIAGTMVLPVTHFSGAGVGVATEGERATQQQRVPRSYADYANQRTIDIVEEARQGCGASGGCDLSDEQIAELEALHDGWWDIVVEPLLNVTAAPNGDCSDFDKALGAFVGWERERLLFLGGGEDPRSDEGIDALREGLMNCVRREYEWCRTMHDVGSINELLEAGRKGALWLGQDIAEVAFDRALKCGTFEFEYEAATTFHDEGELQYTFHVRSSVSFSLEGPGLPAEAPLEVLTAEAYIFEGGGCSTTHTSGPGAPFRLIALELDQAPEEPLVEETMRFEFDPGEPVLSYTLICDQETVEFELGALFTTSFFALHEEEFLPAAGGWVYALEFESAAGELDRNEPYAEKTYSRSVVDGTTEAKGEISFRLLHRPPDVDS